MKIRNTVCLVLLMASVVGAQKLQAQSNGNDRLNIIYIMSDDHAYQAISAYGYGLNHTPNIDKLAEQGVLFTRAFVTNSICGPSRAVMLTGKHSHINGFKDNHSTFDGSQQTVNKLLYDNGYSTAVVGKWHLISEPQGKSFVPVLKGMQKSNVHDALYYHFYENQEHKVARHIGVRTDRYKLIYFYEKKEWELYDLKKDKSEMHNVYNDPLYGKVREMMTKKLQQLKDEYKDTEPA